MNSISIETSRDNYEILKVNKNGKDVYIGSKYNQKREIDKFINSFSEFTENDIYIVIGASMLEHIEELLRINKKLKKVLIIEIEEELRVINEKKISDQRIEIVSTYDEVKTFILKNIDDMNINYVKIGYYTNYDKVYSMELKEILSFIKDISYTMLCNKNTNIYFGQTWFESLVANLRYMKDSTPINDLKDKFKDIPAIIVSAGPSLSKNIKELKNQSKGIVLSGGRTLNTLLNNDINIDYLGVVDPGMYSYELVKDNIEKVNVPLLYYNGSNVEVVSKHKNQKIFCTDNQFVKEVFDEDIHDITGGGSVAHFLTEFAVYTGCNPIIFMGQDLAYTGEKLHDKNALTGENDKNIAWNQATDMYVEDINGEKVRTSVVLNDFRLHLERIIERNPDRNFINATEGGANIKGTKIRVLSEVLNSLKNIEIPKYDERIIDDSLFNIKIQKYINLLNDISQKTKKGMSLIDELNLALNKNNSKKINSCIDKLDKIDKYIEINMKDISLIKNKIFASIYEINNSPDFVISSTDNEKVKQRKNLAKNKAIYMAMSTHSKEAKESLEGLAKELQND
ncbi:MAG: motility associated factor glycosyltransferase family protein [Sarcina sp.]